METAAGQVLLIGTDGQCSYAAKIDSLPTMVCMQLLGIKGPRQLCRGNLPLMDLSRQVSRNKRLAIVNEKRAVNVLFVPRKRLHG